MFTINSSRLLFLCKIYSLQHFFTIVDFYMRNAAQLSYRHFNNKQPFLLRGLRTQKELLL